MKSSAAISLLFFLPTIRAAALPQLVGNELESTSQRDVSGNPAPRSPQPGGILPAAAHAMTDNPSLDPASNVKRDLSARSPQGPDSNPGEFTGVDLSRFNPANRHNRPKSSSSSSAWRSQTTDTDPDHYGEHHRHHNGTHHHKWNSTDHEHRKQEGILTELNVNGEHIVVYNGTHFPNGTLYHPANKTVSGGAILGEAVVAGDEVAVYRQPWNNTRHHHHHPDDVPEGGFWLPSGTGWIPRATGQPHPHRKYPSPAEPGFRGPKLEKWRVAT